MSTPRRRNIVSVSAVRLDAKVRYLCQMKRINRKKKYRETCTRVGSSRLNVSYRQLRCHTHKRVLGARSAAESRMRRAHPPNRFDGVGADRSRNRIGQKRNSDVLVIAHIPEYTHFLRDESAVCLPLVRQPLGTAT